MKKIEKRWAGEWLRLLAFFLVPALVVALANRVLLAPDLYSYYTLREMTSRDDIDLALVGDSVVTYNIDPEVLTEKTGMQAFDVGMGLIGLTGDVEMTRLLLEKNKPQYVVLMADIYTLLAESEGLTPQCNMTPFIQNPLHALSTYMNYVRSDGKILDRLLLFKCRPNTSWGDVKGMWALHSDPAAYYVEHDMANMIQVYSGRGYIRVSRDMGGQNNAAAKEDTRPYDLTDRDSLTAQNQRKILEFVKLCKSHGVKPIVALPYDLPVHHFAIGGYTLTGGVLEAFCKANDIEFFDFSRAKALACLDGYYYDTQHMSSDGSQIWSTFLADFFMRYQAGESVDSLFYATQEERLSHVDFITNAWAQGEEKDGVLTVWAECNCGPNVEPEYRFVVEETDGTQTVVSDYGQTDVVELDEAQFEKGIQCVKVWARARGNTEREPMVYTYEVTQ